MSGTIIEADDTGLVARDINNSSVESSLGEEAFLVGNIILEPLSRFVEQRIEKLVTLHRALEWTKNQRRRSLAPGT